MAIMSLGIAVNDRRKNSQTGEWEDYANFIDCTMFGTRAESVSNYLHKGSKVGIDGKLRYSTWERDGQKRSKLEVIVDELEFLSPRNSQGGGNYQNNGGYQNNGYQGGGNYQNNGGYQGGNAGGYQPAQPAAAPAIDTTSSVYDDDIPF
jgi:single-strand DNA-binding protein